jgi:hypothetical protein
MNFNNLLKEKIIQPYLYVPIDYTLDEAYKIIENSKGALRTIMLLKGTHVSILAVLRIKCPIKIVGAPNVPTGDIIVKCGFRILCNGVHMEHLTIRSESNGLLSISHSFTLNDLIIEECAGYGVIPGPLACATCSDITIRKCEKSGVLAFPHSLIILKGKTSVYENCLGGSRRYYGLDTWGYPSSKIQIVKPLSKETIFKGNMGGGNWGLLFDGQIETIEE